MTPADSDSLSGKCEWSSLPLFGSWKRDTHTRVSKLALAWVSICYCNHRLPPLSTLGDRPSEPEDGHTGLEHQESGGTLPTVGPGAPRSHPQCLENLPGLSDGISLIQPAPEEGSCREHRKLRHCSQVCPSPPAGGGG